MLFGAEVLGLYEMAWAIVSMGGKIGRLGLHRAVVKYVVEARSRGDVEEEARVLGGAFGLGLVVSFLVLSVILLGTRQLLEGPQGCPEVCAKNKDAKRTMLRPKIIAQLKAIAKAEQAKLKAELDLPKEAQGLWQFL